MDSIISQNILQVDTVEYILRSDLTSVYSCMLDRQHEFYDSLITTLAIFFGLIVIFTIWWNIWGVKMLVKKEVAKAIETYNESQEKIISQHIGTLHEKFKNLYGELNDNLAKKLSNSSIEDQQYVNANLEKHNETFEEYKKEVTHDLISHEAELSRAFAIICNSIHDNLSAANWWLSALEAYNDIDNQYMSGIAIDNLLISLDNVDFTKVNRNSLINIEETKQRINKNVPDNRERDRIKLLNIIERIEKKMYEK